MEKVRNHIHFLQYLSVATAHQRRQLLSALTTEQVTIIAEIAFNLLQGNIELSETDYSALCKFKSTFRKLVSRDTDISSKRQLLHKHCTAAKELVRVFLIYNSQKSDSCEDSDSEYSSNSDISDTELPTGLREHSVKYDGTEWREKTDFDSHDPVPTASSGTAEEQPVRCDDSAKRSPASESK